MDNNYTFLVLLPFAIIAISFLFYKSQHIKRIYKTETFKVLNHFEVSESSIITKDNIKVLPKAVQRYLAYVGVIGREKVHNVRIATYVET